ncbi:hypothetical protein EDD16DRAFT_1113631 [Pisolithus croceorrhizus]|nr:hypothetical protein EV401DRAFT_2078213 [Pisolithus croceorrhizus]KAI6114615.1 hypothetical protein EDD16DRAFT_1113631 [Pisolithus croceorrhizus]KAI6146606.1 hypothetical protein EDD17DRAFT_94917 [Pisolithus thermaeus]
MNEDRPVNLGDGGGSGEADEVVSESDGGIRYDEDSGHNGGEESNESESRSTVLRAHLAGAAVPVNNGVDVEVHESSGCIGTGQDKIERSKSGRRQSRVSTNRLRKRFSLKRSSWAAPTLVPDPARPGYARGASLASESDRVTGATLKSRPGFSVMELDDDHTGDRPPLPISMIGLHARMGSASNFSFASSSSFLGSRSECEQATSISIPMSVRDALDADELSGNTCIEEDLQDSDDDVPASPIVFAPRDSGLADVVVDLSQGITERIWMALEKIEALSVEAGVEV